MKLEKIVLWCLLFLIASCAPHVVHPKGSMQPLPGVEPEELEDAYAPRRMALLVGINDFDDKRWRTLRYAERDARDLAAVLESSDMGRFNHVKVLSGAQQTSRTDILEAIDLIARNNTNPRDTVVIYFSTHGTLERGNSGNLQRFLVAHDTRFDDIPGTAIDVAGLQERFGMLKSRRKVLILATCHSGQGKSELNRRMTEELRRTKAGFFVKPLETVSEASVILSACAWGETAREDERLEHDIYTHFLIEALKKFDLNEDGAVTVSEAHDYAREKTYYYTRGQQRATAHSDILGSDPIVLAGRVARPGKPALYSYDESMQDVQVIVDGTPKGKLPGSIVIAPGIHHIELVRPGHNTTLFDHRVKFVEGTRVNAKELVKMAQADQSVGLGVSYRAFFAPDFAESVYAPVLSYGMMYGRNGPWRNTRWDMGLYAGNSSHTLEIDDVNQDADFTRVDLEGALLWEYRKDDVRFAGGPVIGLVYLERHLSDEFENSAQYMVTGLIGPTVNMEISPFRNWFVGLGSEINFAHLVVDSSGKLEIGYAATLYLKYSM